MRKKRLLCLLLCLLLTVCALAQTAAATETEETGSESTEETEPTDMAAEPAPTLPVTTGDASVTNGCRTIDGQVPLTADDTLLETAQAALLYERTTGTLVYAKNPDQRMYPASLTKVMTCMLILEHLDGLQEVITVSESAIAGIDPDGSTANLAAGEEMTAENLLYCLMVSSANDAAAVLAEHVAGSEEAFVEMMNQRAEELGCTNTHFSNPHGLHDENHYSTARDMAKIMLAAQESEEFRKLDSTASYTVPATNLSEERYLTTTNLLIDPEMKGQVYDKRVTGGKTGYTSAAGRCLLCTAEDGGFQMLSVVLGTKPTMDDDGYTYLRFGNFEETTQLLDYGFSQFTVAQITREGQSLEQFPVQNGENDVVGGPSEEVRSLLPVNYDAAKIQWQYEARSGLTAPVDAGDVIGVCRVWYGSVCIAQTDLVALSKSAARVLGDNIFTSSELEKQNLTNILQIAGIVFLGLVALLVVISLILWIRSLVIRSRRRRRRKERRRNG